MAARGRVDRTGAWLLLGHPAGRFRRRFDLRRLAEAMKDPGPSPCTPCGAATWTCRSIIRPGDGPVERSVPAPSRSARKRPRPAGPARGAPEAVFAAQRGPPWREAPSTPAPGRSPGATGPGPDARPRPRPTGSNAAPGRWGHSRGRRRPQGRGLPPSGGGFHPDPTRDRTGAPERGAGAGAGRSRLYGDGLVALAGRGPRGWGAAAGPVHLVEGVDRPLGTPEFAGTADAVRRAAGALAHYRAERAAGSCRPRIDAAMDGLWRRS